MVSSLSTRLWLTNREAGRPFPQVSDDDVLDYLVMEAIRVKIGEEAKEAQKDQERDSWRREVKGMSPADLARAEQETLKA